MSAPSWPKQNAYARAANVRLCARRAYESATELAIALEILGRLTRNVSTLARNVVEARRIQAEMAATLATLGLPLPTPRSMR